ncbi:hypothetical protein D104_01180 [Marinomonas profundimaris]|uniref:Uncharacterized protein n=1 Tax=Marinomonas profundimaris TaxID=1208321 RepID=W1S059_9GAMM|nr:hypothetical protein D104_01180 [Marinomonas profundimaris]
MVFILLSGETGSRIFVIGVSVGIYRGAVQTV